MDIFWIHPCADCVSGLEPSEENGLQRFAQICNDLCVFATHCADLCGFTRICADLRGFVWICAGLCGSAQTVANPRESVRICANPRKPLQICANRNITPPGTSEGEELMNTEKKVENQMFWYLSFAR